MPKQKTIRLNGKDIPCRDILSIRPVAVSDELYSEFTYRLFEPSYHEVKVPVPRDRAYALEKSIRKNN